MDKLWIPLPYQEYLATSKRGQWIMVQLIKAIELGEPAIAPQRTPEKREFCQHPGELHKTEIFGHTHQCNTTKGLFKMKSPEAIHGPREGWLHGSVFSQLYSQCISHQDCIRHDKTVHHSLDCLQESVSQYVKHESLDAQYCIKSTRKKYFIRNLMARFHWVMWYSTVQVWYGLPRSGLGFHCQ